MVSPNNFGASQWPFLANQEILYNLTTHDVESTFHQSEKIMEDMNLELQQSLSSDSSSASILLGHGNIHQNENVHDLQETTLDDNRTHDVQVVSVATPLSSVMIPLRENIGCSSPYNSGVHHYDQELNISIPVSNVPGDLDFDSPDVKFENGSVENVYVENQVEIPQFRAEKKSNAMEDEKTKKSFEKRQRRMIKNRESAARSRAKKQAYTNKLEHNVKQLKMKNDLIKRRTELQREWSSSTSRAEPCRYQLRRTSSL